MSPCTVNHRLHGRPRRRAKIDLLEPRRLMAIPHVGGSDYAAASDTYSLSSTTLTGVPTLANVPVTSLAWEVTAVTSFSTGGGFSVGKPNPGSFDLTLPTGPASATIFNAINFGTNLGDVRVDSFTADDDLRASWLLRNVYATRFVQEEAPDGGMQDRVSLVYKAIDFTFNRLDDAGKVLGSSTLSWDVTTGAVSAAPPNDGTFLATKPDVGQTIEFGLGQVPVGEFTVGVIANSNWTSGGGASVGKPVAQGLSYSSADGRDMLHTARNILTGQSFNNLIYTRRDPASGAALQRYRFAPVYATRVAISDSVFDDEPRRAKFDQISSRYQMLSYRYDPPKQISTSAGVDYPAGAAWNLDANSAHVAAPTHELRSRPLDSISFRLLSSMTLTKSMFVFEGLDPASLSLASPDGGTTWVVSKIADQQVKDGPYAVKLFAERINALDTSSATGPLFVGSAGKSWTLDRSGPAVLAKTFDASGVTPAPYRFDFKLSEPVTATATDGTVPILIRLASNGSLVTTAMASVGADGVSLGATLGAVLADARYTATLPSGSVRDAAGNLLGGDVVLPFFVLAGDANGDARVDFDDLLLLAQNYGQSGRSFSQGNFNYDAAGNVTFDDLLILAQRYGTVLASTSTRATPTARRARPGLAASIVG